MSSAPTILIAARDEAGRIGSTVSALRASCPGALIVVADDGSRDDTAAEAERAGAHVVSLPRRGKGQALTLAEHVAPPGPLLLCDADVEGDVTPLLGADGDLVIAVFPRCRDRRAGGLGAARGTARALLRRLAGFEAREPLSGQRYLSAAARERCFPLAAGFGCEVGMTLDAVGAELEVVEVEVTLAHRETGRDLAGFLHRGRQLADLLLAVGPQGVNHRGLRLPLLGWAIGVAGGAATAAVAAVGLVDDLWSGEERGVRAHVRAGRTTGVLKLVAIPAIGLFATRKLSGALLVGLAANALNQLDTKPGRALKAYLGGALLVRAPLAPAVVLLPYDLREMAMLGDGGANALGALLGLRSVGRLTGRGTWIAIGALATLNLAGEFRSLGAVIERTPVLSDLDRLGRQP